MSDNKFTFPGNEILQPFIKEVAQKYALGFVIDWNVFEGGSNGSLALTTDKHRYIIRFVTEYRTKELFLLEWDVLNQLKNSNISLSPIIMAKDGDIVSSTTMVDWHVDYVVFEMLEGNIFRFTDITEERFCQAIEVIGLLHTAMNILPVTTELDSHIYMMFVLKQLLPDALPLLINENYQNRSNEDLGFITKWWGTNREKIMKYMYSVSSKQKQLIHGDLNPGNFVFGQRCGVIDFERVGVAPLEWDVAYALGAWTSDQRFETHGWCFRQFKKIYSTANPFFEWNDQDMLLLLQVFNLAHVFAGLEKVSELETRQSLINRSAIYQEGLKGLQNFSQDYAEIDTSH